MKSSIVKGIRRVAALAALGALVLDLGGCAAVGSKSPVSIYDLTAPTTFPGLKSGSRSQILVQAPVAIRALDTDRIMVRSSGGAIAYYGDAQWTDALPKLIQARLIESFENSGRVRAVGRPGQGLLIHFQIVSDMRAFGIDTDGGDRAVVDLSVKIIDDRNGRLVERRIFRRETPVSSTEIAAGVAALDRTLEAALAEIVVWVLNRI